MAGAEVLEAYHALTPSIPRDPLLRLFPVLYKRERPPGGGPLT
jgi:hypothetical protein